MTTFRDSKQLKVEKMTILRGTAEEVKLWTKRNAFRRDVLEKPWVLPDKTLRKCRRDAERSEAETEKKRQRLKAASTRKTGKVERAQRRQGEVEGVDARLDRASRDGEEVLKALASSNGGYNALGL